MLFSPGLIPQIVMNPWDPSQAPMMTFALQSYQHQWLLQQQQQQAGLAVSIFPNKYREPNLNIPFQNINFSKCEDHIYTQK